jgi:hypothetical protein
MSASDPEQLARTILDLLDRRQAGATICPSDAARAAAGDDDHWRELMDPVRTAARLLVQRGLVEVTQRGEVVDLDAARGPVRIRRVPPT